MLVHLYITKQWPRYRISEALGVNDKQLLAMFDHHGIELRSWKRNDLQKYPALATLKVGESTIIETAKPLRKQYQVNFYIMAKRLGIRLSVKRLTDRAVRVKHVE